MNKKSVYIIGFMLAGVAAYSQCAMCKAAAESSLESNPNSIARGLNSGILFLMSIPYIVVAVIFRKELKQLFSNLRNKEKTPLNKKNLEKMTFALTFITCAIILFIIFQSVYKPI